MRNDCEDAQWGDGGLPTYRHNARRETRGVPVSAAATDAPSHTTTQTATKTAARTQTRVSTHSSEMQGNRPIPTQSKRVPIGPHPGPAEKSRSSKSVRCLIFRHYERVPLCSEKNQEIASLIKRGLFPQTAQEHTGILNAIRNARGEITATTHLNARAQMALHQLDIIISAAWTVDNGVVNLDENESWDTLKIHAVPARHYMGKGTGGHQEMREAFEVQQEGTVILTNVR